MRNDNPIAVSTRNASALSDTHEVDADDVTPVRDLGDESADPASRT
jgi:hypothetical protein